MVQATTLTPPARYGRAYAAIFAVAHALTAEQVTDVYEACNELADYNPAYDLAAARLNDSIELIAGTDSGIDGLPLQVVDTVRAVLARDRGLITAADFALITGPWVAAGLPLPEAVTGDDEAETFTALDLMTSDRLGDQLLQNALGEDDFYGAVLMLTGYNHGELLAYQGMRRLLDTHRGGRLMFDWRCLISSITRNRLHVEFAELTAEARDALRFAARLVLPNANLPGSPQFLIPETDDTADVMATAFAYAIGADPATTRAATSYNHDGFDPGA